MDNKYDSILYVTKTINESDERVVGYQMPNATMQSYYGNSSMSDDPKVMGAYSFGKIIQTSLNNMSSGYSVETSDFKKWVVVRVSYYNFETSRSASKTFLVVFQHDGDGIILSTHNRYRTISGANQAVSYIRSACSQLRTSTQNKL